MRARAREVREAFAAATARHGVQARVYYAGKAFLSTEVVRWVTQEGLAVDVATGGELAVALAAGADPARLGLHGNNKSVDELERAVDVGIGSIVIDSIIELERLAAIAERRGLTGDTAQSVLVRVNSGVHAETHDFLATAHEDQKFGFALTDAPAVVARIRELDSLRFVGLHCHIGSQIFGTSGFAESAARVVELHAALLAGGEIQSSTSAADSASPTPRSTRRRPSDSSRTASSTRSRASARSAASRCRTSRSSRDGRSSAARV